ncbi:hypothetical protein DAI22_11g054800 [Oryza sativa Japonica Group]|nr:hypothetical protein DAI22_11g054800 [Oryza sativa Japonica Group]
MSSVLDTALLEIGSKPISRCSSGHSVSYSREHGHQQQMAMPVTSASAEWISSAFDSIAHASSSSPLSLNVHSFFNDSV